MLVDNGQSNQWSISCYVIGIWHAAVLLMGTPMRRSTSIEDFLEERNVAAVGTLAKLF